MISIAGGWARRFCRITGAGSRSIWSRLRKAFRAVSRQQADPRNRADLPCVVLLFLPVALGFRFNNCELELPFHWIGSIEQHPHGVTDRVRLTRAVAHNL